MNRMKNIVCAVWAALLGITLSAEPVSQASKAWVKREIAAAISSIQTSAVVKNTNGTITCTSPFTCDTIPGATSISLTFSPVVVSSNGVAAARSFSLLDLLVPRVFAADASGGEEPPDITITITSGFYTTLNVGEEEKVYFNFGSGLVLTLQDDILDPLPSKTHVCEIGSDCYCSGYGKSASDFLKEAEDLYPTITSTEFAGTYGSFDSWIDKDNWPDKVTRPKERYFVSDVKGNRIALDQIDTTDAWINGLIETIDDINSWQEECQEAYQEAKVCDQTNPQHTSDGKECGQYSWSVCKRCGHAEGSEQHDWTGINYTQQLHYCACGQKNEVHDKVYGAKTTKEDGSGWTQTITCSKCPWSQSTDHTCQHVNCKPCSGGDGCTLPCPTCDGEHNWKGKTKSRCARCACDGCGIRNIETRSEEYHSGWEACKTGCAKESTRSEGGIHCCCECGAVNCTDFGYASHKRDDVAVQYEQCNEEDAELLEGPYTDYHWVIEKSECKQCRDPYGEPEAHTFEDVKEGFTHKWLSNEKCAKKKECKKCKYGINESEEDAGGHAEGEILEYTSATGDDGAEVCRKYFICKQCGEECYKDGTHEVNYSDKCRCKNGCGYQFEHVYENEDACGNISCKCGEKDPSIAETHKGFTSVDGSYHKCACGKNPKESHIWGDWYEVDRTDTEIVYKRKCVSDKWGGQGCGHESEENRVPIDTPLIQCSDDRHVALTDACGCDCGYYSATTHIAEDEKFHKWDEEKCKCKCGHKHKFKTGNECELVCAGWRDCGGITAEGGIAGESHHTPATTRCGCLCTALDHKATSVKFHPQAPDSCRCYGASGDGTGSWHYPEPKTGCASICRFAVNGVYHYANVTGEPEQLTEMGAAPLDAHTPSVGMACGCACGNLSESNWEKWNDIKKFHKLAQANCGCACTHSTPDILGDDFHRHVNDACLCVCENEHKPKYAEDFMCYKICRGECGLLAKKEKVKANHLHHTPSKTECGCECGEVTSETALPDFHQVEGSPKCLCKCGKYHYNGEGRTDCLEVCKHCTGYNGRYYYANKNILESLPDNEHTFGDYCECACPAEVSREHRWSPWKVKVSGYAYTCSICNLQINQTTLERKCTRACSRVNGSMTETETVYEGHDMTLHDGNEGDDDDYDNWCSVHKCAFFGPRCPLCEEDQEDLEDLEESSGETDGAGKEGGSSGDIDDLFLIIA